MSLFFWSCGESPTCSPLVKSTSSRAGYPYRTYIQSPTHSWIGPMLAKMGNNKDNKRYPSQKSGRNTPRILVLFGLVMPFAGVTSPDPVSTIFFLHYRFFSGQPTTFRLFYHQARPTGLVPFGSIHQLRPGDSPRTNYQSKTLALANFWDSGSHCAAPVDRFGTAGCVYLGVCIMNHGPGALC